MKKIILALCVALCVCSVALPVMAAEEETEEEYVWDLLAYDELAGEVAAGDFLVSKDIITQCSGSIRFPNGFDYNGVTYYGFGVAYNGNVWLQAEGGANTELIYTASTDTWVADRIVVKMNAGPVKTSVANLTLALGIIRPVRIMVEDFIAVLTSAEEQFSVMSAVDVLALLAASVVVLAFMWWGVRKLIAAVMKAFKKGKVAA